MQKSTYYSVILKVCVNRLRKTALAAKYIKSFYTFFAIPIDKFAKDGYNFMRCRYGDMRS